MNDFANWLRAELKMRKLKQADLARLAKLDTAVVSNLYNRKRGPGEDTCKAIAQALGLPIESVYRAAGLLPPLPEEEALTEQINHDLNRLTGTRRQMARDFIRFLAQQEESETTNP